MSDGTQLQITPASKNEIPIVQALWREYWDFLRLPPGFQNFDEERKTLPGAYSPPFGRLLIARVHGDPAGTAALRQLNPNACEAKRLYVRPQYRGKGVGRALLSRLIDEARAAGYRVLYGDTLETLKPALEMYKQFGFDEVPPYSANPTPGAIYLMLELLSSKP
jgi:GNAT superfamily N-acetyltransferase